MAKTPKKPAAAPTQTPDAPAAAFIIHRDTADLVPYARNSRTHDEAQVAQLIASIREWGWTNPVLIDRDTIIAGHGRLMAARKIYEDGGTIYMAPGEADGGQPLPAGTVPTLDCSGWSEAKRRAYVIADNKLALNAGWNDELLKLELHALAEVDYDLALTGFVGDELTEAMFGEILKDDKNDDGGGVEDDQRFSLLIEYDNERDLERAFEEAQQKGLKCKIMS